MCIGSLLYIWADGSIPPLTVVHRMVGGIDSFPLLAVPFFIYAGNLMNSAGITNRIFGFALALVGWLKGGLGHVNVVGSVVFAVATTIHERLYQRVAIIALVPLLSAGTRRLRDVGLSPWWQAFFAVPFGFVVVLVMMARERRVEAAPPADSTDAAQPE